MAKEKCRGKANLCRYADDFVCAFEYKEDADRFYQALYKRLGKFNLQLSMEKTNIIPFYKHGKEKSCFIFLGFEFRCSRSRNNKPVIKRRTSRKKFSGKVKEFTDWCKSNRHLPKTKILGKVKMKLRGHYNYYGIIGNYRNINQFFYLVKKATYKWLNRRSQRRSFNWEKFHKMLKRFDIENPRITEMRTQLLSFKPY